MSLEHGLLDVFLVHHGSAHRTAERLLRGSQWLMTDLPGGFSLRHSLLVVSEQKCVSLVKSALRSQGKTSHRRTHPLYHFVWGFPGGTSGEEPACQCRRHKRCSFDPWVRKIPWNRKWQPTPVFLPGESHGQRSLMGYSPWGRKESDMTEAGIEATWIKPQATR